ncbi:class I SAM-dependent RNA methyltransferase [Reinekea thalattae]|uniref:class I SAM-dependent RNA methyltransferase n=1 Tax=Reinekea thalattae TaxID=2593301 RepID=UPI00164FD11F|nr:TRAM domain-containing protein [Reinekea thalattae]
MNRPNRSRRPATKQVLPENLTLSVLRFSHDGRGIAQHKGRVVMLANALPGEQVVAKIEKANAKLWQGRAIDVETASEHRIQPVCGYVGRCGGCQLQHMPIALQHELKQQAVADHFRRNDLTLESPAQSLDVISVADFGYRHRARLHVSKKGALGFHNQQGNEVVAIDGCAVFTEALSQVFEQVRSNAPLVGLSQLEIAVDDYSNIGAVALKGQRQAIDAFHGWVAEQGWHWQQALSYQAGQTVVTALPGEFTQVNRLANQQMQQRASDWLALSDDDRVLDLFCGSGNLAYYFQQKVAQTLGLEASESAIRQANLVKKPDDRVDFAVADLFQADVSQMPLVQNLNPTVAVLDPPRAGAEQICATINQLTSLNKILYISCDPATLARDVKLLHQAGWHLRKVALIDMFPQTKHIETMVLLAKTT